MRIEALSGWTSEQRHVVAACFLGWTLDAFDFFLLVFVLKDIAQEFNTQITDVTFAILLTLAMRPVGAYLFGRAADRWGRRPTLMVIYNVGAIIGGISFGSLSERFGRRRIIIIAAVLSLVVLPIWAFAASAVWLAIGAFLMQVMVQGAWGVIPVHLNELSPDDSRGTFPGFVYQPGNLIASFNATLQAGIAAHYGGNYALALAMTPFPYPAVRTLPHCREDRGEPATDMPPTPRS